MWKDQVHKDMLVMGLEREDAIDRERQRTVGEAKKVSAWVQNGYGS